MSSTVDAHIVICGNGGHASSVAAACAAAGLRCTRLDDETWTHELGRDKTGAAGVTGTRTYISGVGHVARRKVFAQCVASSRARCVTVVHPTAFVDPTATIMDGVFIGAFAYVGPGAMVGPGAIINTRATVEHDAVVGEGAHASVGSVLCGRAVLGRFADLFAHATVLPGKTVAQDAVVGAGAVVTQDIPAGMVVAGVPARQLIKREP